MYDFEELAHQAEVNVAALAASAEGLSFNEEAISIAQSSHTRKDKLHRLYKLSDTMNRMVTPYSACRNGCNHCCHMAVSVTLSEAREIAKAVGVNYVNVKDPTPIEDAQKQYMGEPCPFLSEGRCSIYSVRPIACRVYFNMSDNPEICDVVAYPSHQVPCLNAQGVQLAQALALGAEFADIREWFPVVKSEK